MCKMGQKMRHWLVSKPHRAKQWSHEWCLSERYRLHYEQHQLVNPLTAGSVGQHIHITDEQKVAQRERSRICVSEKWVSWSNETCTLKTAIRDQIWRFATRILLHSIWDNFFSLKSHSLNFIKLVSLITNILNGSLRKSKSRWSDKISLNYILPVSISAQLTLSGWFSPSGLVHI